MASASTPSSSERGFTVEARKLWVKTRLLAMPRSGIQLHQGFVCGEKPSQSCEAVYIVDSTENTSLPSRLFAEFATPSLLPAPQDLTAPPMTSKSHFQWGQSPTVGAEVSFVSQMPFALPPTSRQSASLAFSLSQIRDLFPYNSQARELLPSTLRRQPLLSPELKGRYFSFYSILQKVRLIKKNTDYTQPLLSAW